jgi:hypothetical protein
MHGQQMAQQQWLEGQRQAALQQQHAGLQQQLQQNQYELAQKQHAYSMQYGQYGQQMLQIDRLMGRGMTYSDTQQKQVDALDAAWQKVRTDPAAGPDHKQQAWENYIAQKSQIVPMKEPPPPPQETLDKNIVKYKFPDGTEVAGTLGMRNGSLEFKRIENPNETQQNKVAIVQQQLEHKHAEHQMDLQAKQEQAQLDAAIKRQKMQMDIEAHRAKMTMQREHEVSKAYEDLGKKRMALQKPDLLATPEQRAAKDKQIQDNEAFFKSHYGQDFAAIAPDIAAQMGIEFKPPAAPQEAPSPYAPQTTPGGWHDQPPVQGAAPAQAAPPQQAGPQQPAPIAPAVDPWNQGFKQQMDRLPPEQQKNFMVPTVPGQKPPVPPEVKKYVQSIPEPQSQSEVDALPKGAKFWYRGQIMIKE